MNREVEEMSASAIKKYKECPAQYHYKYLSDIPAPEDGEVKHFQIGNTVHDSIENVLREKPGIVDDETVLHEEFVNEKVSLDYNFKDDDKVITSHETASRWISSFVTQVKHIEEEWTMERDGIKFKGFADLVADVEMDDKIYENTIIDWKTGSENEQWKERVQAGMYIEMFYDKFGVYPEAAIFVYLNEETQSVHRRIQDGEVFWNENENKYWTEIEKYKNQILHSEQVDEWETQPDPSNCYFCPFKFHCRDSPVGAEDVEPQHIELGNLI